MGKDTRTTRRPTRTLAHFAHRIFLTAAGASLASAAHTAEPVAAPAAIEERALFDDLFSQPGEQASRAQADRIEDAQALNFFKSKAWDDVVVSGFVASRRPRGSSFAQSADSAAAAADYRTYVGLRYDRSLSDGVNISSHSFYGAGTYDGDHSYLNPDGGALPDEVRRSGDPVGQWLGSDWKVSSRLFERHLFQAGVEYRQKVAAQIFAPEAVLGTAAPLTGSGPERKVGVLANTQFALARDLSLNAGVRYDQDYQGPGSAVDPRVEMVYKPGGRASLRALFDQAGHAPVSADRAYYPLLSIEQESNRVRNYEVGYEQPLTSRDQMRVTAYRYDVNGTAAPASSPIAGSLAPPANETAARIDSTGVEIGMDHRQPGGARASVSYAWHNTRDALAGTNQAIVERRLAKVNVGVPVLSNKLSTAIEVQYHDVATPLLDASARDFVIGNVMVASGELARDTKVSIGVQNVFGVRDETLGTQPLPFAPQDGRTLRVELSKKF